MVPNALNADGRIKVRTMASVYGVHGEMNVSDTDWLKFCGEKGWAGLTKDRKIFKVEAEKQAVIEAKLVLFCLSKQVLKAQVEVDWFLNNLDSIIREAGSGGPGGYLVYERRLKKVDLA